MKINGLSRRNRCLGAGENSGLGRFFCCHDFGGLAEPLEEVFPGISGAGKTPAFSLVCWACAGNDTDSEVQRLGWVISRQILEFHIRRYSRPMELAESACFCMINRLL